MIIVPHNVNSYICNTVDIVWNGSGSFVDGLSEEGVFLYDVDTNLSYVTLEDLSLTPLIINIA